MTSSKGRNFSQDELDALSLWDVPDVLERRSEDVSLDDTVSPVLTVEQIEIMQTQAYDEAFAKGKEEGYKVGFSEGKELGKAEVGAPPRAS